MKPETAAHLGKAERCLANGRAELVAADAEPGLTDDAARNAYYAAFHAAKALLFERTGMTQKRHGGVHTEFHKLASAEPSIDAELLGFLTRAYDFKRIADYDIGPVGQISRARAGNAVKVAERFVGVIRALVA